MTTAFDINEDIADEIANSKSFKNSDNFRHGIYKLRIDRIFADKVDKGRMAFVECSVLEAQPNPQTTGDLVNLNGQWRLKDDGLNPNQVGTTCAMKINFDGNAKQMAGSNIKAFIFGLLNRSDLTPQEVNKAWKDLARTKPVQVGDAIGIVDGKPVLATEALAANPACGMVIRMSTASKEKKKTRQIAQLPPEQREWVTQLNWINVSPPNHGENTAELVAARRSEIAVIDDDDDVAPTATTSAPSAGTATAPMAPPPPAPPTAPAVQAAWAPPAPWRTHPTSPGWYWDGDKGVLNEEQLRAQSKS